ncbi:DUF2195 family protein [Pseudomonas sp. LRF_L74]|uniref:DUF2195 family protein n=1 Tax=Pseudomonas sp. LRF_L74 TaxID=3369422 RepID=UPI003F629532
MLLSLFSLSAQALSFDNRLANCVVPSDGHLVQRNGALFYDVTLDVTGSIGACGCKSALASYRVNRHGQPLRAGALPLKASRQVSLLLETPRTLPTNDDLAITLDCAGPP